METKDSGRIKSVWDQLCLWFFGAIIGLILLFDKKMLEDDY